MLAVSLPLVLLAFILYALRIAPRIAKPGRSSPWDVARHGFTLRMSTTALNSLPRVAIGRLGPAVRGLGKAFYNVGAVAGVIGSGVATAGTAWAVRAAWTAVWAEAEAHAIEQSSVVKRGIDAAAAAGVHASNVGLEPLVSGFRPCVVGLTPQIPGVTAPLSHLPTLLLAFVIAQLIHEWGHAVAAALDDVCPSKFAVNVHLIIPSAAISFPSAVDYLPFRSRARISTAGAWHNLLTCVVLAALAATANLWAPVDGLTIDNVALGYGLETQLKPGDVITHVDDILVAPEGMWQRVINHEEDSSSALGWCIPKGVLLAGELGPCTESHLVAFTPVNFNAEHCLQPHPILKEPAGDCNCEKTHICVKLSKEANVVRIRYWDGKASQQLLWSGDRTVLYAISFKETHRPLKSLTEWASLFNS
ncbi:uncharacterized protein EHS24_005864 [Apiotrichum porosum]|uniref:Endopeptidase S2P n=1 Tax=Apiotrichum porosum TaxID=105984 RepID=A0A427XZP0_9TREE|nr:uncharacterized protein EHS24_005864 [Apiotrichum porosum]RSH84344.1 hypothetical protein EHS24_005864 [Apiotrichum porosum]